MSIILKYDKKKYVPKEELRISRKYKGGAVFLPNGKGVVDQLFNFFNQNKDSIKSVTDTVSNVSGAVGSVAGTTLNTIKGIQELRSRELRSHKAISDKALEDILERKTGGSFYYET